MIELARVIDNEDKNIYSFIYLSLLKIPTTINETSSFIIIISTAFLFRYLISNNELISMRNIGFSIFDIFKPITFAILIYGFTILIFLNPLTAITENKYDEFLDNAKDNTYSINFSKNSLWIKNINFDNGLYYINIEKFNIKKMLAENIKILSINKKGNEFIHSTNGLIKEKIFILENVNMFNIDNNSYTFKKILNLELNFSKKNILSSVFNYRNIPYYNYLNHINTLKKFNLYSSAVGLHYLSEVLKPLFYDYSFICSNGFFCKIQKKRKFF